MVRLGILILLSLTYAASLSADEYSKTHTDALNYFKSEEPKVKDALWTSKSMLKLGLIDDGSKRDGFAEYACTVLNDDYGFKDKSVSVQIIDIEQLVAKDKWVTLGEAECN